MWVLVCFQNVFVCKFQIRLLLNMSLSIVAFLGSTGVTCGAFGAHFLKSRLTDDKLKAWNTAVQYQLLHTLAVLSITLYTANSNDTNKRSGSHIAAHLWTAGTVLFSGSIYGLVLGGPRLLGPVTPLGGLVLIAGWVSLAFSPPQPKSK
eukprot:PhM_4_TR6185/c0_g1_i3/m.100248